MQKKSLFLLAGLVAGLTISAHALEQQTKDAINKAGEPLQRGAQNTATRLEQWTDGQKREFSNEVDAAINDADRLTSKTSTMTASAAGKLDKDLAAKIREQAQTLRERAATLKTASRDNYDSAKDKTLEALEDLQENYYKGIASFSDQRRAEEARVQEWLAALKTDISTLQAKAANAAGEKKETLTDTAKALQENHTDAQKKLSDLRAASGDKWADLREDLQQIAHKAKQAYWKTVNKAQSQG